MMTNEETQAGSPPVVVPNSTEQSLRDHFERILLISEVAAVSLAEQVMEVFTEKEEQAQQLTGRCPSLLEATIEELIILLDAEPATSFFVAVAPKFESNGQDNIQ